MCTVCLMLVIANSDSDDHQHMCTCSLSILNQVQMKTCYLTTSVQEGLKLPWCISELCISYHLFVTVIFQEYFVIRAHILIQLFRMFQFPEITVLCLGPWCNSTLYECVHIMHARTHTHTNSFNVHKWYNLQKLETMISEFWNCF